MMTSSPGVLTIVAVLPSHDGVAAVVVATATRDNVVRSMASMPITEPILRIEAPPLDSDVTAAEPRLRLISPPVAEPRRARAGVDHDVV